MLQAVRGQLGKIVGFINDQRDAFSPNRYEELSVALLSDIDQKEAPSSQELNLWKFTVRLLVATFRHCLQCVIPSFLQNLFRTSHEPRILHRTSFLDGLRGVAAFIVAFVHLVAAKERWLLPSYGHSNDGMGSNMLQLPFIRVFFAARPMVHIFFVISGYVLSCRAIRLMRSGQHEKLADTLVCMIFRRGFRLFLPSIAGIIITDVSAWYGWQQWRPSATLWGKLYNIYFNAGALLFSWRWDWEDPRLLQLWTIPVEFACSMLLFVVMLGVSRLGTWIRLTIVLALMLHSHASGHWGPFEFLAGLFLAEVEELLKERREKLATVDDLIENIGEGEQRADIWMARFYAPFWVFIFLLGLFLAGYPEQDADITWGFKQIYPYTPQVYLSAGGTLPSYFWFSIATLLILVAMFRVPFLRRPFTTSLAQYLGDISYSVYIVHYYIVMGIGHRIVDKAHYWTNGTDTQFKRVSAVLLEIMYLMVIVVWQADMFWRCIDKPVVRFARWFEKVCRKPDG
jgi:peptidoglycan/LPS O-acetylase OafA/YrhL